MSQGPVNENEIESRAKRRTETDRVKWSTSPWIPQSKGVAIRRIDEQSLSLGMTFNAPVIMTHHRLQHRPALARKGSAAILSWMDSDPRSTRLRVERIRGRDRVVSMESRPPLKWLPVRDPLCAIAFLSGYGGGAVAGDRPRVEVEVGAGARLWMGTQAHTRVFRNPDGLPTGQILTGRLETGALCAHLPDPVVPQEGASWSQVSRWSLEAGSTLVVLESYTSGRDGFDPPFSYSGVESRLEVLGPDGAHILLEANRSMPSEQAPASAAAFAGYSRTWNLFVCSPDPSVAMDGIVMELEEAFEPCAGVTEALALAFGRSRSTTWFARALGSEAGSFDVLAAGLRRILASPSRLGTDPLARRP